MFLIIPIQALNDKQRQERPTPVEPLCRKRALLLSAYVLRNALIQIGQCYVAIVSWLF